MSPTHLTLGEQQHARLSLPSATLQTPPLDKSRQLPRSDTLPGHQEKSNPAMVTPAQFAELVKASDQDILLLDLRVYPQYSTARVRDALNLCIPTTLMKRPSYTVSKLAEAFTNDHDRQKFSRWSECTHICVYDVNSNLAKEAVLPFTVLKKFASEGWTGQGLVIKGGFAACVKAVPSIIEKGPVNKSKDSRQALSITPPAQDGLAVAGGCAMPSLKSAANPFFGNIRQNMDLMDGVGQMPIRFPAGMNENYEQFLPTWLRKAAKRNNEGKMVSDAFLDLEKTEQKRLQKAYSGHVSYGSPVREHSSSSIQIAGIERGSKNRYKDILPFDHSRVKLRDPQPGDCDYFNASYVKASLSNRRYIATQAPLPSTFNDFWGVVWEQRAKVIVMLTAEKDGGQAKAHPYWNSGEYGPLKLKMLWEKQISLTRKQPAVKNDELRRPSLGQRRSTNPNTPTEKRQLESDVVTPRSSEPSIVVVRHFALSHSSYPFQPMREVTQLHYSQWPDLGTPAEPTALVELVELVDKFVRQSQSQSGSADEAPTPDMHRPIVVHCSAGCGRTGTFCTIDSVVDMLKRQRVERSRLLQQQQHSKHNIPQRQPLNRNQTYTGPYHDSHSRHRSTNSSSDNDDEMDVDDSAQHGKWLEKDDVDLIAKTVDEFRTQRLSMVQNLRQFVLCYESVIYWISRTWERDGLGLELGGERRRDDDRVDVRRESSGKSGGGSGSGREKEREREREKDRHKADPKRPSLGQRDYRKSYHG